MSIAQHTATHLHQQPCILFGVMQVLKDSNGSDVLHIKPPFYTCRYCTTYFCKLSPILFKNTDQLLTCMFCDKTFSYPPSRDFHMCNDHLNEVIPIISCLDCGDTFKCIHDKERHGCIPELVKCEKKKIDLNPIPIFKKPEQRGAVREVFIGNPYTGVRRQVTTVTGEVNASNIKSTNSTCHVCNSYTSSSLRRVFSNTDTNDNDYHSNRCSLNLPRKKNVRFEV